MDKNKPVKLYKENLSEISGGNVTIADCVEGEQAFVILENGGTPIFKIEFNTVLTPDWKKKAANRILYNFHEIMDDDDLFPPIDNWLKTPNYCSTLKSKIKTCVVKRSFRKNKYY